MIIREIYLMSKCSRVKGNGYSVTFCLTINTLGIKTMKNKDRKDDRIVQMER